MENTEAKLNVTFRGENGDLRDPVQFESSDADLKRWAAEAIAAGSVAGIDAQEADFTDYVVDRFAAREDLPNRLILRPKTPFGL